MQTVELNIGGMTCGGCVKSVTKVLSETDGVASAQVDLDSAKASVQFNPDKTNVATLISAVEEAGFDAQAV